MAESIRMQANKESAEGLVIFNNLNNIIQNVVSKEDAEIAKAIE